MTTMREIGQSVADRHGLTLADLRGSSKAPAVSAARIEAITETRATGRFTTTQIGPFYGQSHHAVRRALEAVGA